MTLPEPLAKPKSYAKKQKLLQKFEVSIWLDTYDDIFSDFDPRPYSERSLSDDFLAESRKFAREKISGELELRLLIPKRLRDAGQEEIICRRLLGHFAKHHRQVEADIRAVRRKGTVMTVVGMTLLAVAAWISQQQSLQYGIHLLLVMFEPAGWFTVWTGLDNIFNIPAQKKNDLQFFLKLSQVEINFIPY